MPGANTTTTAASLPEMFFWNFYIANRSKSTFEREEDVPNLLQQMVPIWMSLILLERVFLCYKKGASLRLNDGLASISTGIMMEITKLVTNGFELVGYSWLYERRFFDLDWQSPFTWWAAAIGVDFGYYWVHRSLHEISLFWCSHQVHHSSEDYTLTTAMRQSIFQHFFSIGFYQPLALLGIPLPALLIHMQFNLFFQFWIHTELIDNIGPLEWIFNTASHHRVHHGINKWCLDKNYAGFLIIWDRMFGTFEAERKDDKIVYGLVSQPQKFEPVYLQLFYFRDVLSNAFSMDTRSNTLKALFCGPGWTPGSPRLGDENAIPDKTEPRAKYDPEIPMWLQVYVVSHFFIVVIVQNLLSMHFASFSWWTALVFIFFVFFSLFTIGSAFDNKWWLPMLEVVRCLVTVAILSRNSFTVYSLANTLIQGYFVASALIWTLRSLTIILISGKSKVA